MTNRVLIYQTLGFGDLFDAKLRIYPQASQMLLGRELPYKVQYEQPASTTLQNLTKIAVKVDFQRITTQVCLLIQNFGNWISLAIKV